MTGLFIRDIRLMVRRGAGRAAGVMFYFTVIIVFPFALGHDLALLEDLGPAIIWVAALLASLLSFDHMFGPDSEDGSLDLLLLQGRPAILVVATKCAAQWVGAILPVIVISPIFGLILNMNLADIGTMLATLLLGTPGMVLIGAVGAALTIGLARSGMLIAILILPLTLPLLIFAISACRQEENAAALMLLAATGFLSAAIAPIAAAAALRYRN